MKTWIKVARYHLTCPLVFGTLWMPWMNMTFAFAVCLIIFSQVPGADDGSHWTGGIASLFVTFFAISLQAIGRSLPFGLMLGVSRRSYYTGTALAGVALAFAGAAGITALQTAERATGGWGLSLGFFRVPYILNGPWYATWLTVFVTMTMLFVYGMWYGIVYRRWGMIGTTAFVVGQVVVALAGVLAVTWTHAWPSVGGFFTGLTALGLTGVIAALSAVLLAGGHVTIRRAAV